VTYKLNQGRLDYSGMELQERCVHSNMHWPNFKDEHGTIMKLVITECCIKHMEYVPKGDRVANSYLMNWCLADGPKSCFSPAWPYHSEWLDSVVILWGKDFLQMFPLTLSEKPYRWSRNTGVP